MGFLKLAKDTLVNLVSGLGTARDKASASEYAHIFTDDSQLMLSYRGSWLARKIINIPAADSFRRWRAWQGDKDFIEKMEAEEKRLNVRGKLLEALIKARLFGGAAVYISTGELNPSIPLVVENVKLGGIRMLTVLPRRLLTAKEPVGDPDSPYYGRPEYYELQRASASQPPLLIHASRLAIFQGERLPDDELFVSANGQGWSDSVLVSILAAIRNVDATAGNIASLIFEAKVDVITVPGLMENLTDPAYASRLLERFQLAATAKGINGTLLLDENEVYEQKNASFAQLPEVLMAFLQLVSGASDIPLTRLLGMSPAGMNATGESDLRNYYDRLQAGQEMEITPAIAILDECLMRSATGGRDPAWHYIWNSLWQISDKERADIGKQVAETLRVLKETDLFPPEALANSGANMLVEQSILPGFLEEIEEAGGHIDFEAEAEAAEERARAEIAAANTNRQLGVAANDATPRTLYVRRDVINKQDIRTWAKSQGFETTQDDLHVTIVYSKAAVDWVKLGESYDGDEKGVMRVKPGGPRAIERFGEAVVLLFASNNLSWRHVEAKHAGASWDHEDYQPHVTISWDVPGEVDLTQITPYRGEIVLGPEIFEEIDTDWSSKIKES